MFQRRHILAIGRILALLLFVANSGFTMALHACTMKGKMACCADAMPAPQMPAPPAAHPDAALAPTQMQCCMVIVAGGANTAPVAPAYSSTQQPQKSNVRAEMPLFSAHAGLQVSSSPNSALFLSKNAVAPPAVEKYVLNAVFLI